MVNRGKLSLIRMVDRAGGDQRFGPGKIPSPGYHELPQFTSLYLAPGKTDYGTEVEVNEEVKDGD